MTGWPGNWTGSWAGGWTGQGEGGSITVRWQVSAGAQAAFGAELVGGGPVYLDAGFAAEALSQAAFGAALGGVVVPAPKVLGGGWPIRRRADEDELLPLPVARVWLDAPMAARATGAAAFGANLLIEGGVAAAATSAAAGGRPAQFVAAGVAAAAESRAAAESEAPDRYAAARAEDEEILWLLAA